MDKARTFDLHTNELIGVTLASEIPTLAADWKKAVYFKCPTNDCDADTHPISESHPYENTEKRAAHFGTNPHSKHKTDCDYNFERTESNPKEYITHINGVPHLRIGFPFGGSPKDVHRRGNLSVVQKNAASKNTSILPISNVAALKKFVEKNFNADDVEKLMLNYQGEKTRWKDVFAPIDGYRTLLHRAVSKRDVHDNPPPAIAVVKLTGNRDFNENSKMRFYCESQTIRLRNGTLTSVKPVIVAHDEKIAQKIQDAGSSVFVAARPFLPPHIADIYREQLMNGTFKNAETTVTMYIRSEKQIAALSDDHWTPAPKAQADTLKAAL